MQIIEQLSVVDTPAERAAFETMYVQTPHAWISVVDDAYPYLLRMTGEPPLFVWYRGELERVCDAHPVACVGSRSMSSYGAYCVETFIPGLVQRGVTVVSGLALGVDAYAHEVALREGGAGIAVVASGIDDASLSPRSNARLARRLRDAGGLIMSEYAPGVQPQPHHFPVRNRIISGLSRAVMVIEAREKSGSLITAHHALEQGRDVFACPGPIHLPLSGGTNRLLQQGATPMLVVEDVADALGLRAPLADQRVQQQLLLSDDEQRILQLLHESPRTLDQLYSVQRLPSHRLMSVLAELELKGRVRKGADGVYLYTP